MVVNRGSEFDPLDSRFVRPLRDAADRITRDAATTRPRRSRVAQVRNVTRPVSQFDIASITIINNDRPPRHTYRRGGQKDTQMLLCIRLRDMRVTHRIFIFHGFQDVLSNIENVLHLVPWHKLHGCRRYQSGPKSVVIAPYRW